MQVREHVISVCSWSLAPRDSADLLTKVKDLGLQHMQLGLTPLLEKEDAAADIATIRNSGLTLTATALWFADEDYSTISMSRSTGGFGPQQQWPQREKLALRAGKMTAELGAKMMSCHVGVVLASSDPAYALLVERVRAVADSLAEFNLDLLIETGPEPASALLQFLNDLNCRNVGVNYDPANMILYGSGDPIASISILGRHIKHVHVKDALASSHPRMEWGKEVAFGSGEIEPLIFLDELEEIGYTGPLCIEREAGENPIADVRAAIRALKEIE
jgi:sugar phosphate isomerase/epimerase